MGQARLCVSSQFSQMMHPPCNVTPWRIAMVCSWLLCVWFGLSQTFTTHRAQDNEKTQDYLAKNWWDNEADEGFQHIDRKYVEEHNGSWPEILSHYQWVGKRVLDYGIGAGYLGETLL